VIVDVRDRSDGAMRTAIFLFIVLAAAALPPPGAAQKGPADSVYTVRAGDTLYSIAQRFEVSVTALQRWNDLEGTAIQRGQALRVRPPQAEPKADAENEAVEDTAAAPDTIPTDTTAADTTAAGPPTVEPAATDAPAAPDSATPSSPPTGPPPLYGRHTAEAGDSFVHLALRLGTTADTLYALNDSTASVSPGQTLRLPRRFAPPGHTVQPDETLYSIAGQYGVSVRALRAANALDTTTVQPGQRLRVPGREAPAVPPPGDWAAPDTVGAVAVYPKAFAGRLTTSGTPYVPDDLVVSHPSLPYGTVLLLSRPDADRHTFARVIDRGPLDADVLLDASAAVAEQLGIPPDTTPDVAVRVVWVSDK
jgi:LysM repeat protein